MVRQHKHLPHKQCSSPFCYATWDLHEKENYILEWEKCRAVISWSDT